jgi:cytochrome c-type biogenesis protein CcmH
MQVHRDQLREVEADVARGILSEPEAKATRLEISRRLLAAAAAESAEGAAGAAPDRVTRVAAPAMIVAALLATGGLYALLGAPGLPDQPLAARQAREAAARADRPGQAEAEAMAARAGAAGTPADAGAEDLALVARLEAALKSRPDDLEGHRLLARSLAGLGRWPEARAAQERVVELLGDDAAAPDLVDLAEMRILAAGGYVSPEAEAALARALKLDPGDPAGRYYSALTLMQGGRPDLAWRIWSNLVAEGPLDAPWIAAAEAGAAEAARMAGIAPPTGAGPGPTAADIAAAESMQPDDRQSMIAGMVDGLAARLAAEGGPPEDWARLIRSLGVLGRRDEAQAILAEARQTHAGDAQGLAAIEAAAAEAGLAP